MTQFKTLGQVALEVDMPSHRLAYYLRTGAAPEPEHGRVFGGKRLFSPEDVCRLKAWAEERRNRRSKNNVAAVGA